MHCYVRSLTIQYIGVGTDQEEVWHLFINPLLRHLWKAGHHRKDKFHIYREVSPQYRLHSILNL